MKKRPKSGTSRAKRPGRTLAYPVEFRLRMVRLFLEEGYSAKVLGEQFGVSYNSIHRWVRDLATEISIQAGKSKITNVEWRISAKQWLLKNGLIKIVKAGKVSPHFPSELCHN